MGLKYRIPHVLNMVVVTVNDPRNFNFLTESNVSLIDFTFLSKKKTSIEKINSYVEKAAKSKNLKNILTLNSLPLVSIDFNHNSSSSIFDLTQTQVVKDKFCRVLSWYDNEWGFSNRMIDTMLDLKKFI